MGKQHRTMFQSTENRFTRPGQLIHLFTTFTGQCRKHQLAVRGITSCLMTIFPVIVLYSLRKIGMLLVWLKHISNLWSAKSIVTSKYLEAISVLNMSTKVLKICSQIMASFIRHRLQTRRNKMADGNVRCDQLASGRTMIHAKDLPLKFWAESVSTAVYILNRSGSSPTNEKKHRLN